MVNVKYVTGLNLVITQLCAMGKRPKFHSFKVAKNLSRFVRTSRVQITPKREWWDFDKCCTISGYLLNHHTSHLMAQHQK